jgi:hypothetical protein
VLRARQETTESDCDLGIPKFGIVSYAASMLDVALIRERFEALSPHLDERGRRLFATTEAAAAVGLGAVMLFVDRHCADCAFWRQPAGGLNPVNRGDMPMAWWARAGLCARHAPEPANEPGPRAFWRATLDMDFCGEGAARKSGD